MDPLRELIDYKVARIISLLLKNKDEFFHLQKISKKAKVPISTTSRLVKMLVKSGIAQKTVVGSFKIYSLSKRWRNSTLGNIIQEHKELIDAKTAGILGLMLKNTEEYFHLQKISKGTGVPISSTSRIVHKLIRIGLVEKTIVGNFKIYRIAGSIKTSELRKLLK